MTECRLNGTISGASIMGLLGWMRTRSPTVQRRMSDEDFASDSLAPFFFLFSYMDSLQSESEFTEVGGSVATLRKNIQL